MITTEVIKGSEVTNEDIVVMNEYRKLYFKNNTPWDHKTNNGFHDRTFFLVRDNSKLVAFGTLLDICITINEHEYDILGIQGIASVIKGQGYGKAIVQEMIFYALKNDETLVGFCVHENAEFYRKSGLKVKDHGNLNFIHKTEDGEEYSEEGDVIYFSKEPSRITKAIENNEKIIHFVPHW